MNSNPRPTHDASFLRRGFLGAAAALGATAVHAAAARAFTKPLDAEQRDWSGADLAAASRACKVHLDFERILGCAARVLA